MVNTVTVIVCSCIVHYINRLFLWQTSLLWSWEDLEALPCLNSLYSDGIIRLGVLVGVIHIIYLRIISICAKTTLCNRIATKTGIRFDCRVSLTVDFIQKASKSVGNKRRNPIVIIISISSNSEKLRDFLSNRPRCNPIAWCYFRYPLRLIGIICGYIDP